MFSTTATYIVKKNTGAPPADIPGYAQTVRDYDGVKMMVSRYPRGLGEIVEKIIIYIFIKPPSSFTFKASTHSNISGGGRY